MNVRKLSKDEGPVQGRIRRPWNPWGAGSDGDSREISLSSSSEASSNKARVSRLAVATRAPRNLRKQLVRSLSSSEFSGKFLKSFVEMRPIEQMLASRNTQQPDSSSSWSHRESRRAYGFRPRKRIDSMKNKSKTGLHPSNNFVDFNSPSFSTESSLNETSIESTSSSHSAVELFDESEVSESPSTNGSYSKEAMRKIERSECLRISSPETTEEAIVLQLKIPSFSAQHPLESLDVEYLAFKVPVMKTKARA